jgi:hypothetical protein
MKLILILTLLLSALHVPENLVSRFKAPSGYAVVKPAPGSFSSWLYNAKLKPANAHTLTYKGTLARTDAYTAGVLDISIGQQDLQQCADAVMRLRGEYLYQQKNYKAISFNFTSGFRCDFEHYANGYRYKDGKWILTTNKDYSYANFMRYMNLVFSYAGTLSLEKELKKVAGINDLQAGDVFIKGGSPGHCFIVMAVATNSAHQKRFMLAQSFIPAQNIQIVKNQTPWFSLNERADIPYGDLIDLKYLKRF